MATVHWTTATAGSVKPTQSWWETLEQEGSFDDLKGRRAIIHLACPTRSAIAYETTRSLLAFLREQTDGTCHVLESGGDASRWSGTERIDLDCSGRLKVDAACLRNGALVPSLWLEDFFLVTVAGVTADPRYGIRGVLAAQATLLNVTGAEDLGAIFEAHRLLAADLNVACGTRRGELADSDSWWAASTDDVSLECAIAAASGITPMELPHLRYMARHETMPTATDTPGAIRLENNVAPPSTIRLTHASREIRRWTDAIRQDVTLASANLHRIPQFIERRWPGLLSFGRTSS